MYNNLKTYNNYAKFRGVTQQTVRDWVASGKIKSVKIDGRLFVKVDDKELEEMK